MKITDICKLSDEVKSGELLECVFLDQVFNAPDSKEADRDFVLRATYPTEQLRSLLEHICQKLSGTHSKGIAVVRGDYGSGKSHTMLALYHLVTAGEEAQKTLNQWGIKAKIPDNSRVAAVQLRSEEPDTLWELIFERTGHDGLSGQIGDYPKREEWASLGHKQPTLIILDELEEWFEGQDEVMKTHTKNALSNLIEASQLPDVPLAVTVTVYGTNDELMTRINRLQPPVYDVGTASEREKIIRHRLVDELDELKAKQVVKSYIDNYQKISGDLPSLVNLADLRKEMEESYPFHPHFLRQAHQVYSGMSRSESTRGIVAVCATLLRQKAKKRDLILTGDLDITDEDIASDLRKLDPELVQNATEDLRQRFSDIHQASNIVGTVLLHSFSPRGTPGASSEDIIIGSMTADANINDLRATWEKVENQGWFIDRTRERLAVTKEVVLAKQIDQMARSRLNTPEGKAEASDYLLSLLSEKIPSDSIFYEQESEQLAVSSSGRGIKYILSLLPLRADSARDILTDLNNTVLLIAPKVHVHKKITEDSDLLLLAQRVMVCNELIKQKGKRQNDVKKRKREKYEPDLKEQLYGSYGRWMRLSRTNELGQEPNFIVRPVECELSVNDIKQKLREYYDIDVMRAGIAKLLRAQGRDKAKGSNQAGLSLKQIKEGLRRERGLPSFSHTTSMNFESAIQRMIEDSSDNSIIIQAGKTIYGYDNTNFLPAMSDDWHVWLREFAPEPPAKEDIIQRVRQELAKVQKTGVAIGVLKGKVTTEIGVAVEDVLRAIVDLVNDKEAVVEYSKRRYPDDAKIDKATVNDEGEIWHTSYAPLDPRKAKTRIIELAEGASDEGIQWEDIQAHLLTEDIDESAIKRAAKQLMTEPQKRIGFYDSGEHSIADVSFLLPDTILREVKEGPEGPKQVGQQFTTDIQSYRLPINADLLIGEFQTKISDRSHIREVVFSAVSLGEEDPLFGNSGKASQIADIQTAHRLVWTFQGPTTKEALINLVRDLVNGLKEKGEIRIEATVKGEVQN